MSNIGSYTSRSFSESQKFLVLDPSTGTTSLVLGSDLVSYITPQLNAVNAESTRLAAENTDYAVGEVIQTTGATSPGDNFAAVYLVVEGGTGDFPMLNGNELLVIRGDDFLREQLVQPVATYNNVSQMIEDPDLTEGRKVSVLGYYSAGDKGSNDYEIVAAGTGTDDGGSFIDLDSGLQARGLFLNGVNINQFGAVGDGVTDDTSAVQSAIDFGSKELLFNSGLTYLVSSLNLISNQRLYTNGDQSILDGGPSRTSDIFLPLGATGVEIDGLEFTRFDRTISHTADVDETPISDVTIKNCYFHDCNQGIYIVWFAKNVWVQNNRFKDITFNGATTAIQIGRQENTRFTDLFTQSSYYVENNDIETVTNTDTVASDTHGIFIRGYSAFITNNNIRNVTFGASSGTGCEGIYIVTWYSKVIGNSLYNAGNREASLVIKGGTDDGVIPTGSFGFNNIVANNSFYYDNAVNDDASAFYSNADNTLFTGNIIEGFGDSGCKLTSNGNSNHVTNNYFIRFTGSIVFNVSDQIAHITNNIIEKPAFDGGTFYCFFVTSGSSEITNVYIKDNNVIVDDDLTAIQMYVTFITASTNDISNVFSENRFVTTNTTTVIYFAGTQEASGGEVLRTIIRGYIDGTIENAVRLLSTPTDITIDIDFNPANRDLATGDRIVTEGESGRIFTNNGSAAIVVAALPAAIPNLEYTFIRTNSFDFRIDPTVTDVIRGGGAGKYLSLDSDGTTARIKCVEAGTWEIFSTTGTTSFEP